ncbi:hypothetical protein MF672_008640 [Actinomadura sp. ATCC 31491]|uniref:Uncharacterized protein n=1 Tax=Actinomadura luzonensis TaxID=2805427 RepID=A0ABT0FPK6_9ACTN|nr:hypothetical protein [Actinomadura luzonensis]MCK2213856.1 hypothetical protein [Actinomadura luzonensis]
MTGIRRIAGWEILEGAGGGYIAVRVVPVPPGSGQSNVRCGKTLTELYRRLEQERRRAQPVP